MLGMGRFKTIFSYLVLSQSLVAGMALPLASSASGTEPAHFDHSHRQWNDFLKQVVVTVGHESRVNYSKAKANREKLDTYLKALEGVNKPEFENFSESQRLAFLINAYNAFTVALIVDHYPVKSIKDIGSFLKSPWKIEFFSLFGEKHYLDNIEHDMIRKWFHEPRIHFALVCASKGCPALRNEAFTADHLESQLEDAAKNFITDKNKNRFSRAQNHLEISSIFKWYGEDFVKKFGSVEAFLAPIISESPEEQNLIRSKRASISYLDYDWSLNDEK